MPVLVYHGGGQFYITASKHLKTFGVESEVFERHSQYLKDHSYTIIFFDQMYNTLLKNAKLSEKPIIITFDDGWKNKYMYALPLLKKYEFTATFYIPIKNIGEHHIMDWKEIKELSKFGMSIGSHTKSHPFLTDSTTEELED
ncbi:MAG: hypothetical protein COU51_00910 [Parcubacteria group bacterium CG10_big_fil_rev_8_21_14_0_10_36_14]|nr:MAG: hypothetical protein COU51_00910 [Parcubacteria group bacterium CG10_big_fil_rev_8_21_14_0_10_36_14]